LALELDCATSQLQWSIVDLLFVMVLHFFQKEKKRNSSRALQQNTKAEKRWCVETEGMKEAITQVLYV
jgi:hypothetical protein